MSYPGVTGLHQRIVNQYVLVLKSKVLIVAPKQLEVTCPCRSKCPFEVRQYISTECACAKRFVDSVMARITNVGLVQAILLLLNFSWQVPLFGGKCRPV